MQKEAINPGRWPTDFSIKTDLSIKQKVQIHTAFGKVVNAVYLGRTKKSPYPLERFYAPDGMNMPINIPLTVKSGKAVIGTFMLATIRRDEQTLMLIKEENLPCAM